MMSRVGCGALMVATLAGCSGSTLQPGLGSESMGASGAAATDTPSLAGTSSTSAGSSSSVDGGSTDVEPGPFWTTETQQIELDCFGPGEGRAIFRSSREDLDASQVQQLLGARALPGKIPRGSDDSLRCAVTTSDSQGQHDFTIIGGGTGVFSYPSPGVISLLGCELSEAWPENAAGAPYPLSPIPASPHCVREVYPDPLPASFSLNLAAAGRAYHIELIRCADQKFPPSKVELFGADPTTPLAVAVPPADPGSDRSCFALDVTVDAPMVAHLVISSRTAISPINWQNIVFR